MVKVAVGAPKRIPRPLPRSPARNPHSPPKGGVVPLPSESLPSTDTGVTTGARAARRKTARTIATATRAPCRQGQRQSKQPCLNTPSFPQPREKARQRRKRSRRITLRRQKKKWEEEIDWAAPIYNREICISRMKVKNICPISNVLMGSVPTLTYLHGKMLKITYQN